MYVKHMKNNEHYDLLFFCAPPPPPSPIYTFYLLLVSQLTQVVFSLGLRLEARLWSISATTKHHKLLKYLKKKKH